MTPYEPVYPRCVRGYLLALYRAECKQTVIMLDQYTNRQLAQLELHAVLPPQLQAQAVYCLQIASMRRDMITLYIINA